MFKRGRFIEFQAFFYYIKNSKFLSILGKVKSQTEQLLRYNL